MKDALALKCLLEQTKIGYQSIFGDSFPLELYRAAIEERLSEAKSRFFNGVVSSLAPSECVLALKELSDVKPESEVRAPEVLAENMVPRQDEIRKTAPASRGRKSKLPHHVRAQF